MKKRKLYIIINIIFLAFLTLNTQYPIPNTSFAQQNNCQASIDKTSINTGEAVILTIICYETEDMPPPHLPATDNFDSRYLNSMTIVTKYNNLPVKATKHRYMLTPKKSGTLVIIPATFDFNGRSFSTQPISVEVTTTLAKAGQAEQNLAAEKTATPVSNEPVFVALKINEDTLYLNQPARLEVKFYVNKKTISLTDVEYPTVAHDNFLIGEFSNPRRQQEQIRNNYYEVVIFDAVISPAKTGKLKLGPAQVKCNVLTQREKPALGISGGIAESEYEYAKSATIFTSPAIIVNVLSFPAEGKPQSFSGAVGSFDFDADVEPKEINTGGIVTLIMKITGSGNLSMIPAPPISASGFKISEPETGTGKGVKTFKSILIPQKSGTLIIDKINFSFFNPDTQVYREITKGPLEVKIFKTEEAAKQPEEAAPKEQTEPYSLKEDLGKDIVYIKDTLQDVRQKGAHAFNKWYFWVLQLLPFAFYLCILIVESRRKLLKRDQAYARCLKAFKRARGGLNKAYALLKQGKFEQFYPEIFTVLKVYLGDKFYIPSGGITIKDITKIAQEKQLESETAQRLIECFREYDSVVFVPSEFDRGKMLKLFKDITDSITAIERQKK